MYNSITTSWRAVSCNNNNYGVANITAGLTPSPCRPCPANMVASRNRALYPTSSKW